MLKWNYLLDYPGSWDFRFPPPPSAEEQKIEAKKCRTEANTIAFTNLLFAGNTLPVAFLTGLRSTSAIPSLLVVPVFISSFNTMSEALSELC